MPSYNLSCNSQKAIVSQGGSKNRQSKLTLKQQKLIIKNEIDYS